jgi:ankyrin repeat protein
VLRGDDDHAARCLAADPTLPTRLRPSDTELLPIWASAGADTGVARLLDAGIPLDARGVNGGTALHYAGLWGQPSTLALLLARGADVNLNSGSRFAPGTALDWTAWGSRELPGASERLDGYLQAARLVIDAGADVTHGMIDKAADEVAILLEDARTDA